MFDRIVVPLDGTPFAEAALAPAGGLAHAFGGRILLVRAQSTSGLPVIAQAPDAQTAWERLDDADRYLHTIMTDLRDEGYDADLTLFVSEPGVGIARTAEIDHSDVIVMATHLRWKLPAGSPPSTTLEVLARSRVPILVWRSDGTGRTGDKKRLDSQWSLVASPEAPVVVPLDGSRFAESALPYAEALARAFNTSLVLVRAVEPPKGAAAQAGARSTAGDGGRDASDALTYLERISQELAESGIATTTVARSGAPLSVIEHTWREFNGGLIVMASHGRTGIVKTFLGSVAARLIEEVEAPVLVVRPEIAQ